MTLGATPGLAPHRELGSVAAADDWCRRGIELVLFGMVLGAPWALGGMLPGTDLALKTGVGLTALLWAARIALTRKLLFRGDPVLAALGGLTLLTAFQLVPLPAGVLRVVSPAALEANERLRPELRERLPGEAGPDTPRPAAFPVSLSPPDTRDFFGQLFPLTLLYAAGRSNLAGTAPLARLAWVCAVNGALLGFLAVAQRVSSPPTVIYWSISTENFVAGPFVNRNHLPYYANVCLGLGCALLAGRFRGGLGEVLNRPAALWLLVLVGATAVEVVVSQSRGGVAAALVAAAGCLLAQLRHARRLGGLGWAACAALVVGAGGSWVGWSSLSARLGALDERPGVDAGRFELWAEGLALFARHPLLGTGNGTFDWVEPAAGKRPGAEGMSADFAHNEYVEALAEGGVVRLGLTLMIVAWPVAQVWRRHRRTAGGPDGGLLLGGLFGFLALAAQSVVDFGLHLPAIAVLAVALLAALMGASDRRHRATRRRPGAPGLALPAAVALAAAGGLVAWDGLAADRAERCRAATVGLTARGAPTVAEADRAVRLLTAAAAARPGNAQYQHELGQAYLARALTRPAEDAGRTDELREALRHWREARDLSPVMAPTHARLGRYRDLFDRADPALTYFDRARSLLPTDAEIIFQCGLARWEAGDVRGACADWRASLALSGQYLADVLQLARARLGPDAILQDLIPDDPALILRAADVLFPADERESPARRAFLEKARDLVSQKAPKVAADWELEARLELALGRPDRAAAAYKRAVGLSPRQAQWRMAYAEVLRQTGALDKARRELETVLAQEPGNRAARDQLDVVLREIQLRPKN